MFNYIILHCNPGCKKKKPFNMVTYFFIAGDGQIEVSEFYGNVPKLQSLSLIGHCTRSAEKEDGTVVVELLLVNECKSVKNTT